MGLFSGIKKAISGVGKVVKKVVGGVVKVGRKVVKGVGKFLGKLGPLGTIALAIIAPYAIGAMAASSIGWVSSLGQTLQAVSSAVSAPFKALGNFAGEAIGNLGTSVAESTAGTAFEAAGAEFQTVTGKLSNMLMSSSATGSVSDGAKNIVQASVENTNLDTSALMDDLSANMMTPQDMYPIDTIESQTNLYMEAGAGEQQARMLAEENIGFGQGAVDDTVESLVMTPKTPAPSLLSRVGTAAAATLAGGGGGDVVGAGSLPTVSDPGTDLSLSAEPVKAAGAGSTGWDPTAVEYTGLIRPTQYAQSLLARMA